MTQSTGDVSTDPAPLSSDLASSSTCHNTHVTQAAGTGVSPPYHTAPSTHRHRDTLRHTDRQTDTLMSPPGTDTHTQLVYMYILAYKPTIFG